MASTSRCTSNAEHTAVWACACSKPAKLCVPCLNSHLALNPEVTHPVSVIGLLPGQYTCGVCHEQSMNPLKCDYPVAICQDCVKEKTVGSLPEQPAVPPYANVFLEAEAKREDEGLVKVRHESGESLLALLIDKSGDVAKYVWKGLDSIRIVEQQKKTIEELQHKLHYADGALAAKVQEIQQIRGGGLLAFDQCQIDMLAERLAFRNADQLKQENDNLRYQNNLFSYQILTLQAENESLKKQVDSLKAFKEDLSKDIQNQMAHQMQDLRDILPSLTRQHLITRDSFQSDEAFKAAKKASEVSGVLAELAAPRGSPFLDVISEALKKKVEKLSGLASSMDALEKKLQECPDKAKDALNAILESGDIEDTLSSLQPHCERLSADIFCEFVSAFVKWNKGGCKGEGFDEWVQKVSDRNQPLIYLRTVEKLFIAALENNLDPVYSQLATIALKSTKKEFLDMIAKFLLLLESRDTAAKAKTLLERWAAYLANETLEEVLKSVSVLESFFMDRQAIPGLLDSLIQLYSSENARPINSNLSVILRSLKSKYASHIGFELVKWTFTADNLKSGTELIKNLSEFALSVAKDDLSSQLRTDICELSVLALTKVPPPRDILPRIFEVLKLLRITPNQCLEWMQMTIDSLKQTKSEVCELACMCFIELSKTGMMEEAYQLSKHLFLSIKGPLTQANMQAFSLVPSTLAKVWTKARTVVPNEPDLLSFIRFVLEQAKKVEDIPAINDFLSKFEAALGRANVSNPCVMKLARLYQANYSLDVLASSLQTLMDLSFNVQESLFDLMQFVETSPTLIPTERSFLMKVTFHFLDPRLQPEVTIPTLLPVVEIALPMVKRAAKLKNFERRCDLVELVRSKPTLEVSMLAEQLAALMAALEKRGHDIPVLTDDLKRSIYQSHYSKQALPRSDVAEVLPLLPGLVEALFAADVLPASVVTYYCCALIEQSFANYYPSFILRKTKDPCVLSRLVEHLRTTQLTKDNVFSFRDTEAPDLVYIEPTRMKFFNFKDDRWNDPIQLQQSIKASHHSNYTFLNDDRIFCCGGYIGSYLRESYILDRTGGVQTLGLMITARGHHGIIFLASNRVCYVFGGCICHVGGSTVYSAGSRRYSADLKKSEMFSLEKLARTPDQWQWDPLPDMNQARHAFNPCLFNGLIYLCGDGSTMIERFDPQSKTFANCIDFAEAHHCVLFEDSGKLVIISNNKFGRLKVAGNGLERDADYSSHRGYDVWCSMPIFRDGKIYISQNSACIAINKDNGEKISPV